MSGERAGTHQNDFWKVVAIHRDTWELEESKCHPSFQTGQERGTRDLLASQPDFNAWDQLTWIEHSANNTKVVGLVPYGPFTQQLALMILEDPFQWEYSVKKNIKKRMMEHLILEAISLKTKWQSDQE